jgi:hypothetical protein
MTITVLETDGATNLPSKYLLKKSTSVYSGNITTEYFTFTTAEKYSKIALANENITEIISVTDSDGNS